MMRNKLFEKICKMGQDKLKKWLVNRLEKIDPEKVVCGDGYVYYEGAFPVLLTAHMDTVHKVQCKNIKYMSLSSGKTSVYDKNGIGGDDRCGVYMTLKLLERIDCSVLFCEDEEVGSIGAGKFVETPLCESIMGKNKYIVELDRMNDRDAVFYYDDNEEFHKFITEEFWKEAHGTWSDICELSPALEISSVNLSCGYYKQHTTMEYVILEEMETAIEEVYKLLLRTDINAEPFKYVEKKYQGSSYYDWYSAGYGYYDKYDNYGYSYNGKARTSYDLFDDNEDLWKPQNTKIVTVEPPKEETIPAKKCLEVLTANGEILDMEFNEDETLDGMWREFFFTYTYVCVDEIIDYYLF